MECENCFSFSGNRFFQAMVDWLSNVQLKILRRTYAFVSFNTQNKYSACQNRNAYHDISKWNYEMENAKIPLIFIKKTFQNQTAFRNYLKNQQQHLDYTVPKLNDVGNVQMSQLGDLSQLGNCYTSFSNLILYTT